jgi:hypothetical protein
VCEIALPAGTTPASAKHPLILLLFFKGIKGSLSAGSIKKKIFSQWNEIFFIFFCCCRKMLSWYLHGQCNFTPLPFLSLQQGLVPHPSCKAIGSVSWRACDGAPGFRARFALFHSGAPLVFACTLRCFTTVQANIASAACAPRIPTAAPVAPTRSGSPHSGLQ